LHFTAFHPDWKMLDRPPTPPATLTRARAIARRNGVRYAYTGNVWDVEGQSTTCHACGAVLIARYGYELGAWNLTEDGACSACGAGCAGMFEARPGSWGSRRRPVRMAVP
jgi:pyruvate formate lyase activating enzyme